MTYQRIDSPADLPAPGAFDARVREKSDIDFKRYADAAKSWEHAKDIGAFANSLGGVLLIGADDSTGALTYPGVTGQSVADVMRIYELAATLCSPTVVVDPVPLTRDGVPLVAINVDPHVDHLVAAPAGTRDRNGAPCKHADAWVFPIRRASQTEFIEPKDLPMFMHREVRRAVVLLSRIPPDARREVTVHYAGRRMTGTGAIAVDIMSTKLHVEDVSVERNRVRFCEHGTWELRFNVPLLDVVDVWESAERRWDVRVAGEVVREKGAQHDRLDYRPLHR